MSSFNSLFNRVQFLSEAKVSPYVKSHPAFGPITSKMKAGGLSSAPLDTIKFIAETLYYLDIIGDEEFFAIKKAGGFSGKKNALLATLQKHQDNINKSKEVIATRIEETLDNFINGVGVNRGREEKYAAQAAAQELAKEIRKSKSGKEMDDALTDAIAGESLLVKASLAKMLNEIRSKLGEAGVDIEEEALSEVEDYVARIDSVAKLKSFIKQISNEPGYEVIAAYLSSIVKPIETGVEDEEMYDSEDAEDPESLEEYDVNEDEYDEVMGGGYEDEEYDDNYSASDVVRELQDIINTPDEKLIDVVNISSRISWDKVAKMFPKIYPHVKDMWKAVMSGRDTDKVKEIANNAIEATKKLYPRTGDKFIKQFQSIIDLPDDQLNSAIKVSSRVSWDTIGRQYPKLYGYVKDMWSVLDTPTGAKTVKEIAKKAIEDTKKYYSGKGDMSGGYEDEEFNAKKADIDDDGKVDDWEMALAKKRGFVKDSVDHSYTSMYLTEQVSKDNRNAKREVINQSFKEKYKPKTVRQLMELRNYGL